MSKRIELKVGERIPLTKGGLSELVYLGEAGMDNTPSGGAQRKTSVKCLCGNVFDARLGNIRSGNTTSCITCAGCPPRRT